MSKKQKPINLALQGGGAHGAFTWGVLDAILEDGRLDIESISATSAGAMNAAALAYGKSVGGAEKAREVLEEFWQEISRVGAFYAPVRRTPFEMMNAFNPFGADWSMNHSSSFALFDALTSTVSPYQFNPLNLNPLRDVLERSVEFDEVHGCECVKLFISVTNVHTGTARIFRNEEVTLDVLMASAALPFLFQAVEIDGQYYWDGGYMGNPALWPFFYEAESRDILIVHINPIFREDVPKEAYAIQNRIDEITFNSSLIKDIRAVSFVKKLIEKDMLRDEFKDEYKNVLLHAIRADDVMRDLSTPSKFDTDWGFLLHLKDLGREKGIKWLKDNYKNVGQRDSVDIDQDYLSGLKQKS